MTTQVIFAIFYALLVFKYYKEGGSLGTGKYICFTIRLERQIWYHHYLIYHCIYYMLVAVVPTAVLFSDVDF